MIRDASISDDTYVPYAMTNRELTERSIKYKDLDIDGLVISSSYSGYYYAEVNPQLPAGSNIISVVWRDSAYDTLIFVPSYGLQKIIVLTATAHTVTGSGGRWIRVYYF